MLFFTFKNCIFAYSTKVSNYLKIVSAFTKICLYVTVFGSCLICNFPSNKSLMDY